MSRARFRWCVLALASAALSGCVTVGSKDAPPMPADVATLFKACAPADGGVALTVREDEETLGSGELDWVAKPGSFESELSGPIGQTLLALKWSGGRGAEKVEVGGELADRVPTVQVTKQGFLEVDGHFVGLKAAEVPCVLQAALPSSWPSGLVDVTREKGGKTLAFSENRRTMTVTIPGPGATRGGYCAEIAWPIFLVFHRSLTWCVESREKAERGTVTGLGGYDVAWTKLKEQNP